MRRCRLEGGDYHGDRADLRAVPASIIVYPCPDPYFCSSGNDIHWDTHRFGRPGEVKYVLDRVENNCHIFVPA